MPGDDLALLDGHPVRVLRRAADGRVELFECLEPWMRGSVWEARANQRLVCAALLKAVRAERDARWVAAADRMLSWLLRRLPWR